MARIVRALVPRVLADYLREYADTDPARRSSARGGVRVSVWAEGKQVPAAVPVRVLGRLPRRRHTLTGDDQALYQSIARAWRHAPHYTPPPDLAREQDAL